jgi:hypothetical protein
MDTLSDKVTKNLYAWAELTDLCLMLKRSVLAATVPEERLEHELFLSIREWKERQWRVNRTSDRRGVRGPELDREYLKNWANRLGLDLGLGNEGGANTDRKETL